MASWDKDFQAYLDTLDLPDSNYGGKRTKMIADAEKDFFKQWDTTQNKDRFVLGKSDWSKLVDTKMEDLLYGAWKDSNLADMYKRDDKANNVGVALNDKNALGGVRGIASEENAQYVRRILKGMYPDATEKQLDQAAVKAFKERYSSERKQWSETTLPTEIVAAIGKHMPGGIPQKGQEWLDKYTPMFAERRKVITNYRNQEDDAPSPTAALGMGLFSAAGAALGMPVLGGFASGMIGGQGDIKAGAKGAAAGYLGGKFSQGLGSLFGGSGGATSGGGLTSYLDDIFGNGSVSDGSSLVDLGGSIDDYLGSFNSGQSLGGLNLSDFLDNSGMSGGDLSGSGDFIPSASGSSSGFSLSDLFSGNGGNSLSDLFSGKNAGILKSLLTLGGGILGDRNTDKSLDFLSGALNQYGDPFKYQRNFATDLWTKSYTNPESLFKEYMSGQGQDFARTAAAQYSKAGRRNMLPTIMNQAHNQFYSDYLPKYRAGVNPSVFNTNNANSILGGITNLQGNQYSGILGSLSNIFS